MSRPTCPNCERPLPTCFCDLISTCEHTTRITILQHPNERNHPKGTAPLLQRSLTNAHILTGLEFQPADVLRAQETTWLLYPATANYTAQAGANQQTPQHLMVLDGTWRNSRQLLLVNPWLQTLPRFAIQHTSQSHYHIRKAQVGNQLSTLEATLHALNELEPGCNTQGISTAFEHYMQRLASFMPSQH